MVSDRFLRSLSGSKTMVGLSGDLFRVALWIAAVFVLAGAVFYSVPSSWRILQIIHFNDFGRFFYATANFQGGGDMYAPSPATPVAIPGSGYVDLLDLNPPLFHVLLWPLTGLTPANAFAIWSAFSLVLWFVSLLIIQRELRPDWTISGTGWLVLAMVASAPTLTTFVTGQLTFLLMLPITLAWRAVRRNSWREAAIYLGAVTSFKLFVAVFGIYFLVRRQWQAAIVMACAASAGFVIGLLTFGVPAHAAWLHALGAVSWPWLAMNASLLGLLTRALGGGPVFAPAVDAPGLVRLASIGASVVLLGITTWTVIKDDGPGHQDRSFLALLLLALLISPLGWVYYLWLAAGPAAAVWLADRAEASRVRDWLVALAIPGLFVPIPLTLFWASQRWSSMTIGSIYTWSAMLLWAATIVDARLARHVSTGRLGVE